MATFIGLDLAWTTHRETGICRFDGRSPESLVCTRLESSICVTQDLATEIAGIPHPLVVAIDAPLIVTLNRWVERDVGRRFGRFKASAHSASLELLRRTGRTAGMDLGKALQQYGTTLDPSDLLRGERCVRTAVEVYPHVIDVCLFGLTERLPYKAKTGRSVAFRRAILCEYQDHLRSLLRRYASGVIPVVSIN